MPRINPSVGTLTRYISILTEPFHWKCLFDFRFFFFRAFFFLRSLWFAFDPVSHSQFCFTMSTRFRDPQLHCHLPWIWRANKRNAAHATIYYDFLIMSRARERNNDERDQSRWEKKMKWKKCCKIKMVKCDGIEIQIQIVFASLFSHFNLFYICIYIFIFFARLAIVVHRQTPCTRVDACHRLCFARIFLFPLDLRLINSSSTSFRVHICVDLHSWNVLVCCVRNPTSITPTAKRKKQEKTKNEIRPHQLWTRRNNTLWQNISSCIRSLACMFVCALTRHILIAWKAYKLPNYGEKCKFSRLHFQIFEFYQFSHREKMRLEQWKAVCWWVFRWVSSFLSHLHSEAKEK